MTKQYDPNWPFPQYTEDGTKLLPADFDPRPVDPEWPWDIEEALV